MGATMVAFVPGATIKDIFSQQEVSRRRCRWINRIQEFNIDIFFNKFVRGQHLARLIAEENLDANQINQLDDDCRNDLCYMNTLDWYKGVIFYLWHMKAPLGLIDNQKRALKLQAIRYIIVQGLLWWRDGGSSFEVCE